MKDDKLYLLHISECLDRIDRYVSEGEEQFMKDTKTQDAVLRNLQVMAESTQRLSSELKLAHPEVDWRGIAGFRNILVHDYLGISLTRIWEIIEGPLKKLKDNIDTINNSLDEESGNNRRSSD
jgi:uncharacterized protein with HEPN domain